MYTKKRIILLLCTILFSLISTHVFAQLEKRQIIVYVWDGLRPDSVNAKNTPHLYALMQKGVAFKDNHSSYPTFTMMNASSFATGDFAGKTGFFGNVLWSPHTTGNDSSGKKVDFNQPVFTEDYKILEDLVTSDLVFVNTLFQLAHQQHITTAAVGKSGPAFFQDYKSGGIIFDEKHAYPLAFAQKLQQDGFALPKNTFLAYSANETAKLSSSADPTAPTNIIRYLNDAVTADPTDHSGSPFSQSNEYMMRVYLEEILPNYHPQLSVVWMRNPDTTEHLYGPGSANYLAALKSNDDMLGELEARLKALKLDKTTDIIVVSDHAHSNVSAPFSEFPLREINHGEVGKINPRGYSVSGEIRVADLLTKAGFHAYDGQNCVYDPILSGILKNGNPLYSTQIDHDGNICGQKEAKYTTPSYLVPAQLPNDAVIIAANGGSDYLYVPSHNSKLIENLVAFFQTHEPFGAIFIDDSRYGTLPGTLPLATVKLENIQGRSPDIIVGFTFDDKAKINGLPGIEFSDGINNRGMHGSFSPIDVHNFMMAYGPDFHASQQDHFPTGNVDLAPTLAYLLQLKLENTDGRILFETFNQKINGKYQVKPIIIKSQTTKKQQIYNAIGEKSKVDKIYEINLHIKALNTNQKNYYYFDQARAIRR